MEYTEKGNIGDEKKKKLLVKLTKPKRQLDVCNRYTTLGGVVSFWVSPSTQVFGEPFTTLIGVSLREL